MTQTVRFGTSTTELPLTSAPSIAGGITAFEITPSDTVTAESVVAVVKDADSFIITTDGAAGEKRNNFVLSTVVGLDKDTENIVFSMRQKSSDEIQKEQMQAQIDALGAQVAALTLGGAAS